MILETKCISLVKDRLSDDLRKPKYRGHPNKYYGHCYVACEALYHLGLKDLGYKPYVMRVHELIHIPGEYNEELPPEDDTHWFLMGPGEAIVDPTRGQFEIVAPLDYTSGRCCGFLTKEPSKRARILMRRISENIK